jgi:hypothetical protein
MVQGEALLEGEACSSFPGILWEIGSSMEIETGGEGKVQPEWVEGRW